MNKFALIAVAGIASGASAQSIDIVVDEATGTITGTASGLPAGALAAAWDFAGNFSSADGTIDLTLNAGFTNPILAPVPVSNNGTNSVDFLGVNSTQLLPSPAFDGSNPIELGTFTTTGSFAGLNLTVSAISYAEPGAGFPNVVNYADVNISYVPVPAPATAGLLGLGGLVAARRRR